MVTPVLKAKFDEMGVPLIPLENGARRFVAELQQADRTEVEVVIGGMPQEGPLINPQQQPAPVPPPMTWSSARHRSLSAQPRSQRRGRRAAGDGAGVVLARGQCRAARRTDNALRKLRVLKGIPLPAFGEQPTRCAFASNRTPVIPQR
jgi:hypothetical protein